MRSRAYKHKTILENNNNIWTCSEDDRLRLSATQQKTDWNRKWKIRRRYGCRQTVAISIRRRCQTIEKTTKNSVFIFRWKIIISCSAVFGWICSIQIKFDLFAFAWMQNFVFQLFSTTNSNYGEIRKTSLEPDCSRNKERERERSTRLTVRFNCRHSCWPMPMKFYSIVQWKRRMQI